MDDNDDKKGKGKKKAAGGKSANLQSQNTGASGLNSVSREQEVIKQQFKQKQKTAVFDVPSTSSK